MFSGTTINIKQLKEQFPNMTEHFYAAGILINKQQTNAEASSLLVQ